MPYTNVPRELWGKMDRCVSDVEKTGKTKEQAIAICHAQLVKREAVQLHEAAPAPVLQAEGGGLLFDGVLLCEGTSLNRNRYSVPALQSAVAVFAGQPIFVDHPGRGEQSDRPERSVRDLVGRLPGPDGFRLEAGDDGRQRLCFQGARLSESAAWLSTLIREGIAGDMSISASGTGQQEGDIFAVESFTADAPASLDFVTRAAAGGRARLRESDSSKEAASMAEQHEVERLRVALKQARREARQARAARLLAEKTRGLSEAARARVEAITASAVQRFVEAEDMPAVDITLPEDVQAIPEEAQAIWLRAYMEGKGEGEDMAAHLAWAAVLKDFSKAGGQWEARGGGKSAEDELGDEITAAAEKEKPTEPEMPKQEARRAGMIVGQGSAPAQGVTEADLEATFKKFLEVKHG